MPAITDDEKKLIKGIVSLVVDDAKLYAFGSRVDGSAKKSSDLDVVIKSKKEISLTNIADIKELLKASRLPYSVDIMYWDTLSDGFKNAIKDDLVEI
jgi:predicted nucleotidyltransferase